MERDGDSPSFWFQPPITPTRSYRRPSSPIINPVILIILLPILALLLLFFLLPPVLSHASFIFRPNSVKKSWDSVNVFLVLFAVLCGVLARRNHDTSSTDVNDAVNDVVNAVSFDDKLNSSVPDIWFEDSDTKFYTSKVGVPENGVRRLRRNSSYPDLKQESPWETGDNRYRFYDDFAVNLNLNRSPGSEYVHHRVRRSEVSEVDTDESDVKEIPVDTFVNRSSPSLPRKSPSPPPAPPMKNLSRRTYRSVPKQDEVENRSENNETEFLQIPTPPPTPPPPPPAAEKPRLQQKREKRDRKINSATKDIATTITSLYNQSKRKRKHKTRNIYDNSTQSPPSAHSVETVESELPPAPAPPPPPPPLPSVFHNMFRKGTKSKRIHSLSATVPPAPPPPPPGSIFNNMFKNSSKSKRFSATTTNSISSAPPPPPPPPSSILNTLFKTGSQSKRFQSTSISPPSSPPAPPASLISNQKSKRMSHIHIQPPPEAPPPPPPQQPEYSRRRTASSWKPPLPTRANSYYEREEYLNSGAQSPLIPVPPPPPPFKMAETKFMFSCEISSNQSSRSTSPERENVGSSSMNRSPSPSYGGASTGSGFCPSPDVNVKAASFIARLRDEWRLEKMNSVKERQKMGPTAGP